MTDLEEKDEYQFLSPHDSDELLLADEETEEPVAPREAPPWRILIVDDDKEVHTITQLVLNRYRFDGRPLEFLNAYSAQEAKAVMDVDSNDIALVLLDVVMEHEHAGLEVVRYIRETIENDFVRIILRTGQPGQAPENKVVMEYDINDYKEKTELTAKKLFTTVTTALRGYRDLRAIERSREGLSQIVDSTASLFEFRSLKQFAAGLLTQFTAIFHLDNTSLYAQDCGFAATRNGEDYLVLAATGKFADGVDRPIREVVDSKALADLEKAASEKRSLFNSTEYIGYFETKNGSNNLLYFKGHGNLTKLDHDLLRVFENNVAVAFDNIHLNQEIIDTQKEVIFTLGEVVENRSTDTAHHVRRVAEFSRLLALKCGMDAEEAELLRMAAPMHDVGKVAVSEHILNKPGPLTDDEFDEMKQHALTGLEMLRASPRRIMKTASIITHQHHERWDGAGYPQGLQGEDIHIHSRIIAVADVFDALTHRRVYKEPWEPNDVFDFFAKERGRQFDPRLVDILQENRGEFLAINSAFPG